MKSVIYQIQSDQFPRIRIGTGSEHMGDIISFVLGGFKKDEVHPLEEAVDNACRAAECIVKGDVNLAMNRYNTKHKKKKKKKAAAEESAEQSGSVKDSAPDKHKVSEAENE
jgi:PTH1 family peptidyl-tRNA hydrolase